MWRCMCSKRDGSQNLGSELGCFCRCCYPTQSLQEQIAAMHVQLENQLSMHVTGGVAPDSVL
jgi:hypothetical protein